MSIEQGAERLFKMTDDVWQRHANPWSVWTRYTCLPLLVLAVYSKAWLGWWSLCPIVLAVLWIWLNPRLFSKPTSTDNWASRAVLGERVWLSHPKSEIPGHHRRVLAVLKVITLLGLLWVIYGMVMGDLVSTVAGIVVVILGKSWLLDRMVWLYQDLASSNQKYQEWLY